MIPKSQRTIVCLDTVIPFGPHKDQTVGQIMESNLYYVELMEKEGFMLSTTAFQHYKSVQAELRNI